MTVLPIPGERFRFTVTSAESGEPHIVDLYSHGGRGECSCRDWQCRCQPLLHDNPLIVAYGSLGRNVCKHIHAATTYVGQVVVAKAQGKNRNELYK